MKTLTSSFSNRNFGESGFVLLKNNDWLVKQRKAGKVAAQALQLLEKEVANLTPLSLNELNKKAEDFIISQNCFPTFKNYKGFPAAVCISVNKQMVHGIPTDYCLQDGDVVTFDLGATYEGAIADTAITCIYGKAKSARHTELINITKTSLDKAIAILQPGKRLGNIGYTIHRYVKNYNLALINQYGGHGLDWNIPHASPFVANRAVPEEGIRLQPGLTIAIEPMCVIGSDKTYVDKDGWTVWSDGISAHFEHTIFVHEDRVEVITQRDYSDGSEIR